MAAAVLMVVPIAVAYDFFSRANSGADYYSTVSQVIAAMYLAVALESFTGGGVTLGRYDQSNSLFFSLSAG